MFELLCILDIIPDMVNLSIWARRQNGRIIVAKGLQAPAPLKFVPRRPIRLRHNNA